MSSIASYRLCIKYLHNSIASLLLSALRKTPSGALNLLPFPYLSAPNSIGIAYQQRTNSVLIAYIKNTLKRFEPI